MKRGFYTIMAAQFFSSLADNALFVAAVELIRISGGAEWQRAGAQSVAQQQGVCAALEATAKQLDHSLLSATYRKSLRPATARSVFQVSMWVRESLALPSVQRNATGTLPSALMVRMTSSCLRSGRCALDIP